MKFTEAVEKAFKDPESVYERKGGNGLIRMKVLHDYISFFDDKESFLGREVSITDFEADWQLVLQEVTWQEAIEAWLFEDKKVKWLWVSDENTLEKEYGIYDNSVPIRHIMNGKWYILED